MARISLNRVAGALALVFVLVLALAGVVHWRTQQAVNQVIQSPATGARVIAAAVSVWQAERQGCPTARELVEAKLLDPFNGTDRWGSPYLIECTENTTEVRSFGADQKPNTFDDVVVKERK